MKCLFPHSFFASLSVLISWQCQVVGDLRESPILGYYHVLGPMFLSSFGWAVAHHWWNLQSYQVLQFRASARSPMMMQELVREAVPAMVVELQFPSLLPPLLDMSRAQSKQINPLVAPWHVLNLAAH